MDLDQLSGGDFVKVLLALMLAGSVAQAGTCYYAFVTHTEGEEKKGIAVRGSVTTQESCENEMAIASEVKGKLREELESRDLQEPLTSYHWEGMSPMISDSRSQMDQDFRSEKKRTEKYQGSIRWQEYWVSVD